MTGQIIANVSKILEFDDGLKNTVSKIDSVISDNEALIQDTTKQIIEI